MVHHDAEDLSQCSASAVVYSLNGLAHAFECGSVKVWSAMASVAHTQLRYLKIASLLRSFGHVLARINLD
ncbi:unnamed protein product, partial [Citrullus colocynthis]